MCQPLFTKMLYKIHFHDKILNQTRHRKKVDFMARKSRTKIYENIKERRKRLGMSQSELASKVNYSDKGMISRVESGKVDLPLSKVEELAEALNTSPEELMGRVEKVNTLGVAAAPSRDAKVHELVDIYDRLNHEDRNQLLKIAKTYLPDK